MTFDRCQRNQKTNNMLYAFFTQGEHSQSTFWQLQNQFIRNK